MRALGACRPGLLGAVLLACRSAAPPDVGVTGWAMGGEVRVRVRCGRATHGDCLAVAVAARDEVDRIEGLATDGKLDSPIGRLNASAGRASVELPPEVASLLASSLGLALATDGAYDPTLGALLGLWDFDVGVIPNDDDIADRLGGVDHRLLELSGTTARLARPQTRVTLEGIARGYAAQAALRVVPTEMDALIDIGGDARADLVGDVAARGAWELGVQHPRRPRGQRLATLTLEDAVLATAGDHEKGFERDGVRYHHVLDPRTGRPSSGAQSVMVVHEDGAVADGLATALMVLGPREDIVSRYGAWALLVDADGQARVLGEPVGRVSGVEPEPRR